MKPTLIDTNALREGFLKGEYTQFLEEKLKRVTDIDWQKYRMEVAKSCFRLILSDRLEVVGIDNIDQVAEDAVIAADALIAELKKTEI